MVTRAAVFAAAPTHAEADLVVAEEAALDQDLDVVLQVEGRHVADRPGLVPAVEQAVADRQPAAWVRDPLLGVDGILAGPLALLESRRVLRQRSRPQRAALDEHVIPGASARVELDRVPRGQPDVAIADRQVRRPTGDAVCVLLLGIGAGEGVVDLAGVDDDVAGVDGHGVVRPVADLAVAERDAVGLDLHEGPVSPLAVDEYVLVDARLGDREPSHARRIGAAADVAPRRSPDWRASPAALVRATGTVQ